MKILFLSRWFPYPFDNGAKIRIFHLLQALAETHTVDLISFFSDQPNSSSLSALGSVCRRIEVVPYRTFQPHRTKALLGFFSDRPRSIVDTHQPEMSAKIAASVESERYDLVIASQIDMAPYAQSLHGIPKLFEEVEISTYLDGLNNYKLSFAAVQKQATWWKLSRYLRNLMASFDGWTVVSEQERKNLSRISSGLGKAQVIPNGADLDQRPAPETCPHRDVLIYAGSLTYRANFDAVNYFMCEILPLIQQKHPAVRFYVTGSLDKVDLSTLPPSPALVLTGYLADISTTVAESWVSVIPLRIGGGTRLKILESLSLGTPVISTSKGMEGLDLIPGNHILTADDPEAFANQVNLILDDEKLRFQLSRQGRQQVQQKYNWKAIGRTFREYAEEISHRHAYSSGRITSI